MPQIKMDASEIGGTIHTQFSGIVTPDEEGVILVDARDVNVLQAAGAITLVPTTQEREAARKARMEAAVAAQKAVDEEGATAAAPATVAARPTTATAPKT